MAEKKSTPVPFACIIAALLLIASGAMALAANNEPIPDAPLPPEVKKLIGMKTSPEENPGDIPGWIGLDGFGIKDEMYLDVLQKNKISIIAIKLINRKEKTISILDARVIPGKLFRTYVENGEQKWRKNEKQWYRITKVCIRDDADGWEQPLGMSGRTELIIGMWKFEPNSKCTDPSSLVKKAWLLNTETGRLTDIPTQGVSCREPDCGDNE